MATYGGNRPGDYGYDGYDCDYGSVGEPPESIRVLKAKYARQNERMRVESLDGAFAELGKYQHLLKELSTGPGGDETTEWKAALEQVNFWHAEVNRLKRARDEGDDIFIGGRRYLMTELDTDTLVTLMRKCNEEVIRRIVGGEYE